MAAAGDLGAALALLLVLFVSLAVAFSVRSMPSYYPLKATHTQQTIVRARATGNLEIVDLGLSFGKWLTADEIPQVMKDAMISVEDRRYYSHFGIDPVRTGGAIIEGLTDRVRVGGSSTISQQLARNVFLNNNRSLDRKLREAILAMALEWKFSKEQILELYLNKVYFGGGAYGIDLGQPQVLQPSRNRALGRRGGDHRRAGQGAQPLFA